MFIKRHLVSWHVDFIWGFVILEMASTFCLSILIEKLKQNIKKSVCSGILDFYPLTNNKFNDLLKVFYLFVSWLFFLKGFYYAYTAGLTLKWLFLQWETGKRSDRAENLIEEYEIQNSYSKAGHPRGTSGSKMTFIFLSSLLKSVK